MTGDEDELVAACQDVMRGIESGDISKEEVKKAKIKVRKVSTETHRHCEPPRKAACSAITHIVADLGQT